MEHALGTEERAFRSGQIHLTDALPVGKIDAYRRESPELLRIDPYRGTYFFRLNTRHPFLSDPRVRRALNLAVNRTAIVTQILRGGQIPSAAFTPSGTGGYIPPATPKFDFDAARALLASAGFPDGKEAAPIEILFNTSENHRLVAEAIQEMWRRELGLEVTLRNMENRPVLDSRRTGDFSVLRSVWIADYADATSFLDIFRSESGNTTTPAGLILPTIVCLPKPPVPPTLPPAKRSFAAPRVVCSTKPPSSSSTPSPTVSPNALKSKAGIPLSSTTTLTNTSDSNPRRYSPA
ncbi:MAG: hypothetical protein J6386_06800 [Candidatus Synoicihabitans palmerolidicus]|nr:hypothetical protein [Candidatus Synoicihabitans palmerolidicus]